MDNHRGCKTQIIAKHSKTKTNLLKKRKKESPDMQYIELGNNKKCVNLNFTELVPQYLPDFTKETHPNSTATQIRIFRVIPSLELVFHISKQAFYPLCTAWLYGQG